MINIKIKGPNTQEAVCAHATAHFPLLRPRIWIGRGQDVAEKEGTHSYALNLASFSKAVSRVHACLLLSPAFFCKDPQRRPLYFNRWGRGWGEVSERLRDLVWEFARPARRALVKDVQSKAGVFRKLEKSGLFAGMAIVLGDSRPVVVQHQEIYDSSFAITMRLEQLQQQGFVVLNPAENKVLPLSFWVLSYRSSSYVLLDRPSKVTIGRSSQCQLALPEAAISRKHAILQFQNQKWVLQDGDGTSPSSNGVWVKSKRIWMDFEGKQSNGEAKCKVGDILLSISIREEQSILQVEECVSFNRSTDGSLQELKKEAEFQQPPFLRKYRSQL